MKEERILALDAEREETPQVWSIFFVKGLQSGDGKTKYCC